MNDRTSRSAYVQFSQIDVGGVSSFTYEGLCMRVKVVGFEFFSSNNHEEIIMFFVINN